MGLNPLDYGAKGDLNSSFTTGTDDTAAFELTLTTGINTLNNRKIHITNPPGGYGYRVDGPVPQHFHKVLWEGDGSWVNPGADFQRPGQIVLYSFGNGPIFSDPNPAAPADGHSFKNLTMSANQIALEIKGRVHYTLDNCTFKSRTTSQNNEYAALKIWNTFWYQATNCSYDTANMGNPSLLFICDNSVGGITSNYLINMDGTNIAAGGSLRFWMKPGAGTVGLTNIFNFTPENSSSVVEILNTSGVTRDIGWVRLKSSIAADPGTDGLGAGYEGQFRVIDGFDDVNISALEIDLLDPAGTGEGSWPPLNIPTGSRVLFAKLVGDHRFGDPSEVINRGSGGWGSIGRLVWERNVTGYSPTVEYNHDTTIAGGDTNLIVIRRNGVKRAAIRTHGEYTIFEDDGTSTGGAFSRDRMQTKGPATIGDGTGTKTSIRGVTGVPDNGLGSNGDYALRSDGTVAGKTCLYHKEAGVWVAVIP